MKGIITLSVLAAIVCLLAFGGYVVGSSDINAGEEVTVIITTLGKTSTERFDVSVSTALDLLKAKHDVKTTSDYYIKCIDDVCTGSEYFWSFYVNGKMFPKSASTYQVKRGDIIEFRFGKR